MNRAIDIVFFIMALTSSCDIVLTFSVYGLTVRCTQFFEGLMICMAVWKCIDNKCAKVPANFLFIVLFVLINLAFTFHTVLPLYNIAFSAWLILFVLMVWAVSVLYEDRCTDLMELYLLTFYIMAVWGIVQFLLGYTGITNWSLRQTWFPGFPRVNGFTYEPSYYATYMIMCYLSVQTCCLFGVYKIGRIPLSPLSYLSAAALVLCSSRMAYIPIAGMLAFAGIKLVCDFVKKRSSLKTALKEFFRQYAILPMLVLYTVFAQLRLASLSSTANAAEVLLRNVGSGGDTTSASIRMEGWRTAWELFLESPIYGYGLGGISSVPMAVYKQSFTGNIFLEILAATGIFGMLAFLAYGWTLVAPSIFKKGSRDTKTVIELALAVAMLGECLILTMNQNILRCYTWTHLAVLSCFACQLVVLKRKSRVKMVA